MFALEVTEELESWAEQTSYKRKWVSNKKSKVLTFFFNHEFVCSFDFSPLELNFASANLMILTDTVSCVIQLSPEEAYKFCRYDWMRDALQVFVRVIEERGSRRAEKLVELPMFPAADSMAEHQMLTSAGCSEKPPTVQHLEESFTNKCIVQG